MEKGADSVKLYDQNNTLSERHIKADKNADERVPDQMCDRYRLGDVIGTGGMSEVYRATDSLRSFSSAFKAS